MSSEFEACAPSTHRLHRTGAALLLSALLAGEALAQRTEVERGEAPAPRGEVAWRIVEFPGGAKVFEVTISAADLTRILSEAE